MIKSGLIGAGIGFIYLMSLSLVSPFCTFCLVPFLGVGVGFVVGWFDQPQSTQSSLKKGAGAGVITGVGAVSGQVLAAVVNGILVTNFDQLPTIVAEFGFSEQMISDSADYWLTTLVITTLCSTVNFIVMAGLGALGSLLYFRRKKQTSLSTTFS